MGGRLLVRSLAPSVAFSVVWASNGFSQTAPPPASWAGQPQPAASAPATPAPAPAPSATAAFPAAAPATAAPAAPPAAPATAAPTEPHRMARVRFQSDEPGALLESDTTPDGRRAGWYVVCEAPCDQAASANGFFRVSGAGYHPSRVFRLPEGRNDFAVSAEMEGSSIALPMALTIVGGVIASVGGLLVLAGASEEQNHRDGKQLIYPGAIIGGTGAVIATIGMVMLLVETQHNESKAHVAENARGLTF
jgi:hypothetical protein